MSERTNYLRLQRTGMWVPRVDAKQEALSVYFEFSMNLGNIEDLSILSHVYHLDFAPEDVKRFLSEEHEQRLVAKNYISDSMGELASRMTLKSHVAANMIVAEVDESAIGGYLVEPFDSRTLLDDFHSVYLRNRRQPDEEN